MKPILAKKYFVLLSVVLFTATTIIAQDKNIPDNKDIPHLRVENNTTRLIVDNKPFLMLAGELHNSTSSAPKYFAEAINNAVSMNVNTLIASVAWEQFEPLEGKYDYSCVDFILKNANEHNLKVVLVWFASWKNGESSYAPIWVKKDTKRFFRIRNNSNEQISAISPFCKESMMTSLCSSKPDAKSFQSPLQSL